ncbi:MAG: hypothetical protein K2Q22_01990 [Cytophagales bacterium]|nr:hypothetical protein [Cytophagales bacterium]
MQNIKHHAIIVTSNDRERIELVRKKAIELYTLTMEANNGKSLVGPLTIGLINNFYTFLIAPDGSKEGYDTSDDGDIVREKICTYIDSLKDINNYNPISYIEVYFGTDHGTAAVVRHN